VNLMLPSAADIPEPGERVLIDWKAEDLHLMEDGP
jgi:hypothetical protein